LRVKNIKQRLRSNFYSALKEPCGIGLCPDHGRTFYVEINSKTFCFHDLAKQICPDLYEDTLHAQTLLV